MIKIRGTPRWTLLIVLAAAVMYLLAFGPALWLICQNPPRWMVATVYSIYEPLELLARKNDTINGWLVAYCALWTPSVGIRPMPTLPYRWLQPILGTVVGCWFIWNIDGWLDPRKSCGLEATSNQPLVSRPGPL
jgi:hypothetical protein